MTVSGFQPAKSFCFVGWVCNSCRQNGNNVEARYIRIDFSETDCCGKMTSLKWIAHTTQAGLTLFPCLEYEAINVASENLSFPLARTEATTIPLSLECENWIMPKPISERRGKHTMTLGIQEQDVSHITLEEWNNPSHSLPSLLSLLVGR